MGPILENPTFPPPRKIPAYADGYRCENLRGNDDGAKEIAILLPACGHLDLRKSLLRIFCRLFDQLRITQNHEHGRPQFFEGGGGDNQDIKNLIWF